MIPKPEIGQGATLCYISDRVPCTVIRATPTGNTIWLQEDGHWTTPTKPPKDRFVPDKNGRIFKASWRPTRARYVVSGGGINVLLGERLYFRDREF